MLPKNLYPGSVQTLHAFNSFIQICLLVGLSTDKTKKKKFPSIIFDIDTTKI